MANTSLHKAKDARYDEFYTRFEDIEFEIQGYINYNPDMFRGKIVLCPCDDPEWSNFTMYFAQNFKSLGLKKLICTSYAVESKIFKEGYMPSLFETESQLYNPDLTRIRGKIFELTDDTNNDGMIDVHDLQWHYLEGDGDFLSEEVTRLRDEADIIATNPPFSKLRVFIAWVMEAGKKFILIGNKNAITYKEVFPYIKDNKIWVGYTSFAKDLLFIPPKGYKFDGLIEGSKFKEVNGEKFLRSPSVWYTNMDHCRRHEPLQLMTMADNLKFNKSKKFQKAGYTHYDNYDAIDVPETDAIPSDYDGKMGVPISFLDKYCPEQFEIVGNGDNVEWLKSVGAKPIGEENIKKLRSQGNKAHVTANMNSLCLTINGRIELPFKRIIIRKKH